MGGSKVAVADFRVSLYADDLVILVALVTRDLEAIKAALQIFGLAFGLFSNFDKSVATPIHCTVEDLQRLNEVLACRVEHFPCRYLGIPLSVFKLKRSEEQFLIDKVAARIPGWKGNLLSMAGRTALVKATLSAIPVHVSIALCLSPWAIGEIDRLRRAFIWIGSEVAAGGRCRVAWTVCCWPKELGGLGISDLRRVGIALRLRWVWRDRRASRMPVSRESVVLKLFQAATVLTLGNGESTFFWTDVWLDGRCIEDIAPSIFATVSARKKKTVVAQALAGDAWVRHVQGPVTAQ